MDFSKLIDDEERANQRSLDRYHARKLLPGMTPTKHRVLWLVHNCISHPILAFVQNKETIQFHQITSRWLNNSDNILLFIRSPKIVNKNAWIKHNLLSHLLIGLFPFKPCFEYHDKTAREMNVEGWV